MCNGKCYLSKELTNNNQSSNKTETTKVVTNILDSFVNNNVFELTKLELFETEKNNKTVFTSDLYLFFFSKDIFHPPLV